MLKTLLHNLLTSCQTFFQVRNYFMTIRAWNLTVTYKHKALFCTIIKYTGFSGMRLLCTLRKNCTLLFGSLLRSFWHFKNHVTSKYFTMLNIHMLICMSFYFKSLSFHFSFILQFKYCDLHKLVLLTFNIY